MNTWSGARGSRWAKVVAVALVGTVVAWSAAQAPPEYAWSASTMTTDLPAEVMPGYTLFTLASGADTNDNLTIFRLHEGTTLDAFEAANDRIDQAFMEGGDVAAALNEGLAMVDVVAQVSSTAGESRSVGVVLTEGRYALEYGPESEGLVERTYQEFRVAGAAGAPAPPADATVHFVDFAFAFPPDLPAGEQTWLVRNSGVQLHHLVIFTLADGATLEDFVAYMEEMEEGGPPEPSEGEPLSEPYGYIGMMSAGEESYHFLDLAPGQYVAVCFLPDHLGDATGQPHFMLGMMQIFRVGE